MVGTALAHVATALTVYGIETLSLLRLESTKVLNVATALTVYGIETLQRFHCHATI